MIDIILVRIHFIIEMIWWTGLAPREFEFPFPGSLISTFPVLFLVMLKLGRVADRGGGVQEVHARLDDPPRGGSLPT